MLYNLPGMVLENLPFSRVSALGLAALLTDRPFCHTSLLVHSFLPSGPNLVLLFDFQPHEWAHIPISTLRPWPQYMCWICKCRPRLLLWFLKKANSTSYVDRLVLRLRHSCSKCTYNILWFVLGVSGFSILLKVVIRNFVCLTECFILLHMWSSVGGLLYCSHGFSG